MGIISKPELLTITHNIANFNCNNDTLNDWLKKRSFKNQKNGASRTFVIGNEKRVIGYYALATGSIERIKTPKSISRNMPSSIPVIILGRLAVDIQYHRKRLGVALLKDAILRTLLISENAGVKALLVHAISEEAKNFYRYHDFIETPSEPMTLLLSMKHIKDSI